MKFTVRDTPNPTRFGTEKNSYDFKTVEILQFNYDGKGGIIILVNNNELEFMNAEFLEFLIEGRWYSNDVDNDAYIIEAMV